LLLSVARGTGATSMALAAAALTGFATGTRALASAGTELQTMKPNTAVAILALGFAVRCLAGRSLGAWRHAGRLAAALALAIGGLTLFEYVSGIALGIDQLLMLDPWTDPVMRAPGRPSLGSAGGIALLAGAVLLADAMLVHTLVQAMAIAAGSIGGLALLGLVFDSGVLYGVRPFVSIGPNTALSLLLLAMGTLAAAPDRGVASLVAAETVGGAITRRLVPIAIMVPFALVGVAQIVAGRGWVEGGMATAMLVVALAAVMGGLVLHAAGTIHRLDGMRTRTDAMLRESTSRVRHLSAVLDASDVALLSFDGLGRILTWNPAAERAFGRRASAAVGRRASEVFAPEVARLVANALEPALRRGEAQRIELVLDVANGAPRRCTLDVAPLIDWERRIAGACAVLREPHGEAS
jgi:PAS domain S-box-containing protein